MAKTLSDIITLNFDRIAKGPQKEVKAKVDVKVPGLKPKRMKGKQAQASPAKKAPVPDMQSILGNIMKSAATARAKAEKDAKDEDPRISIVEEHHDESLGGYGTSRRGAYNSGISASYSDYGRLFSYLGSFRAKGAFEELGAVERTNRMLDEGNRFFFLDSEVIDTGMKQLKYMSSFQKLTGEINAVPMGGINSKDWEMLKLWKQIDPVMYSLKMSTM
ncbi:hypothetical protein HYX09_06050 [Candidatus Woesearchaeota archaeon]|nr:hypothetical protein [Candidatus Woesearchaeota archaeon]